jgi:hypothetical protein
VDSEVVSLLGLTHTGLPMLFLLIFGNLFSAMIWRVPSPARIDDSFGSVGLEFSAQRCGLRPTRC